MSRVAIEACNVSIDAAVIAAGFAIDPVRVQPLMHKGSITSTWERGLDEDAGQYRLTFFYGEQCLLLVTDAAGNILERSTTAADR